MGDDDRGDVRPATPEEQAANDQMWLEIAAKERFVDDITGEGEPPIVLRFYKGEVAGLMRALRFLLDRGVRPDEAEYLLNRISDQMRGQD